MYNKKLLLKILIVFCVFFSFFSKSHAETVDYNSGESIKLYNADIVVNKDNSIDVSEEILYDTGQSSRHGIYRDIDILSSQNKVMEISSIKVTDENNTPYNFILSKYSDHLNIKIGDADTTFSGSKKYIIKYHATRAIAQLQEMDEIYWNVTGNRWTMPIYNAKAQVHLPSDIPYIQSACYYGALKSNSTCSVGDINKKEGLYQFSSPTLYPNWGMTIALGFQKGFMTPYTSSDSPSFFYLYKAWFVGAIISILSLIFCFLHWYRRGRDPKGRGIIVPQYDVPDSLTPLETVGIVKENIVANNISAEIIYLATRGYLKINQIEDKVLGLFKSVDYQLVKIKDYSDLENDFDKRLLDGIFGDYGDSVSLSTLKYRFTTSATESIKLSLGALVSKGYYKNLGKMKTIGSTFLFMGFFSFWASFFFGGMIASFLAVDSFPIMLGIFLAVIIYGIFSYFSPAKTEKGVLTKEYLLGLKEYLQIAEKDRLIFHNAPEKKPEIFEKLLPYAMVLGVASIWAKEFEGIYTYPPSWYSGSPGMHFSAIAFSQSLSDFSSDINSSFASTRSGSGGGGFSGGGGGGGGGGSW